MRVVPLTDATDAEFESSLAARRAIDRHESPWLSPMTEVEWRYQVTDDRRQNRRTSRFATIDTGGTTVALAEVELSEQPENAHVVEVLLEGEDQGRSLLLGEICRIADQADRTTLIGWCGDGVANDRFWRSHGLELVHRERQSVLDLRTVDGDLMASWIDRAAERAGDVTLASWTGWWPSEHTAIYLAALESFNDAPTGDLDVGNIEVTADAVRHNVAAGEDAGEQRVTMVAHENGVAAGMTTVIVNLHRPDASWQGLTGVTRDFRERGIGRWLKAAMWRHLHAERPEVTHIRTFNANVNDAMLGINDAMGFEETFTSGAWQASVADVNLL